MMGADGVGALYPMFAKDHLPILQHLNLWDRKQACNHYRNHSKDLDFHSATPTPY